MKNSLGLMLLLISIVIELMGECIEPPSPLTPLETLNGSADSYITKSIMDNIIDKKYKINYMPDMVVIKQYISGELGSMSNSAREAVSNYSLSYDASTDKIAQTYSALAKKRGHTVKIYKQNMNLKIAKIMPMTLEINNEPSYMNLDKALVEYEKNNRIKSALIRVHTISNYVGWIQYRYTIIIYGSLARIIESKIGNDTFSNLYITTMK